MVKEENKSGNSGKADPKEKGKNKVWRPKLGSFVFVSIYDLVTWVGLVCVLAWF
jgi:hypothetical protein